MTPLVRISPVGKLCAFAMAAAGAELVHGAEGRLALIGAAAILLAVQGLARRALIYLAFCAAALSLLEAVKALALAGISLSPFYLYAALRLAAPVMTAEALARTEPGEIVALMSSAGLGPRARLAALVAFRAVPAVLREVQAVLESLRSRGSLSLRGALARPLGTLEVATVPVFLRLLTVSDQLAASAQARGAGRPGRVESLRPVRPGGAELALLGLLAAGVLATAGLAGAGAPPPAGAVIDSDVPDVPDVSASVISGHDEASSAYGEVISKLYAVSSAYGEISSAYREVISEHGSVVSAHAAGAPANGVLDPAAPDPDFGGVSRHASGVLGIAPEPGTDGLDTAVIRCSASVAHFPEAPE
ncbi:MAG: energy-coupling factor transporter transmembrane protein EcfT [Deltaproteobacteria bacterium]|nr:energy-coupling factor transporter transmembrane protein EcfT [Deltaproteobacteria bacterium]